MFLRAPRGYCKKGDFYVRELEVKTQEKHTQLARLQLCIHARILERCCCCWVACVPYHCELIGMRTLVLGRTAGKLEDREEEARAVDSTEPRTIRRRKLLRERMNNILLN